MAFNETGTQPLIADDQRADKPDVLPIGSLVQNAIVQALGGAMGFLGSAVQGIPAGVLFGPTTSYSAGSNQNLTIGPGLYFEVSTGASPDAPTGSPVGRSVQCLDSQTINLNTFASTSATCAIWAKRVVVNGRARTRKRWLPGASAESTFSPNTQANETVTLAAVSVTLDGDGLVTASGSPPDTDYFPIMVVTGWTGSYPGTNNPTISFVSLWDGTRSSSTIPLALWNQPRTRAAVSAGIGLGLFNLLYRVRRALSYVRSQNTAESWDYQGTYRGLKELDSGLATVEDKTARFVLASARVVDAGAGWVIAGGGINTGLILGSATGGDFGFTIVDYAHAAANSFNVTVTQMSDGVTPSNRLFPQWTDLGSGTFGVYFFDSAGTLTEPSANGFSVVVTSREA